MPSLGSLYYTLGIKDMTEADLQKVNTRLKNLGLDIQLTPKILKDLTQSAVPKGIKIELDPTIKNEALARAVEGKVMRVAVSPLLTGFREAIVKATRENPPQAEVGVSEARLRTIIQNVLNKQGFMLNISTVNDNYSKAIQAKLNGTSYKVKIHADAREIAQSVQASLMQVQSRHFGLQVSRDMLYRSIDEALGQKRFNINIAVQHDQARRAVQDALLRAQVIGKDQALAYQRLQTGEMKAAQAELMRLKAAHQEAANAAKAHATTSVNLGGAMGSNIKIAGELGSAMTSLYSIHAAKQFLSQVIEIGGELEHQKIAMDTIFGDKGKTNVLFEQVKGLARTSPFGVMELTKSVKALSAYGVQYNEIYETAKRLADISAATSVDINRLILAFGKTKSRGFLDGLEAKQFAYANIPIYEMVRKKLEELEGQAVTTQEVMERMRKREISFDIVKDVLWDITDPGGKFYDMQEALAGSVKTSWKLVRDNIELMFGEIAESAVGNTLKSTAEILQGLTREWRTVGAVVAAAAVGYGVFRVATLGLNQVMQKGTATAYQNLMAEKQRDAQRLRSLSLVMDLTAAEKARIATASKLTNAELAQALKTEKLTLAQIEQLFVTGKLNKANIMYLFRMGLIDKEGARAILTHNRLAISIKGVGMAMASAGKAIGAFLLNPWTIGIAAISGLVALWQRNSEQMDKSKEIGEGLFTRATESAKNLKQVLTEVGDEVEKLTDIKIAEAISKLETAIKDYSPTPEKTLRETRLDEDGKIRSSQEYAKALQAEVKALEEAAALEEKIDIGKISENAMNNAKGVLDDNLAKDLEQYADSFKKADREISKYISDNPRKIKQYVDRLTEIDAGFAEATKGMDTYAAKFREMVVSTDKYSTAALALEGGDIQNLLSMFSSTIFADERSLFTQMVSSDPQEMKKARKEAVDELKEYMGYVKTALEEENIAVGEGVNMSKPVQIMMARLANTILENAKNLPQDQQDAIRELWNNFFGLDFDDTLIFGGISDGAKDALDKLPKELAGKLRNGISYDELDGADKELVDKLIEASADELEKKFPHLTDKIHDKLNSEKFIAEIVFSFGKNAALTGWQRQLNDAIGDDTLKALDISIGGKADIDSFIGEARKGYKAANEAIKELKPILIKAGISFVDGEEIKAVPLSLKGNEVALQAIDEYNEKVRATKAIKEALKAQGIDLDVDPNKRQRTPKDKFAEDLKQRLDILKKAYGEYKKELALMSKDAALAKVKEAGIFDELFTGEDAITDFDSYEATLEKLLADAEASLKGLSEKDSRFKGRHDLVVSLRTLLNLEIPRDRAKEALDKAKREIDSLVSETTKKWDFYKAIFAQTGDKEASMRIAFGENIAWTDATQQLQDELNNRLREKNLEVSLSLSDEEAKEKLKGTELYDLWKKVKDAIEKDGIDLRVDLAKAVYEASSITDKIKTQEELRNAYETELRAKLPDITESEVEAALKPYNDKIEELKSSMLELLPIWEQIFGDHQYQSYGQIQAASDIAKQIIDNAKINKDANGKPVSFTSVYTDSEGNEQQIMGKISQLEKLRKAIQELYKEGLKKNPFVTLWESLKKVFNGDWKDKNITEKLALIGESAAESAGLVANLAGQLSALFDAAGNGSMGQAMTDVQNVMTSIGNIGQGFAQGGIVGGIASAAGEAVGWVTKLFQRHDAKLQKQIERSKEVVQNIQNAYDAIERRMANFLGNAAAMNTGVTGGAYGKQRELMQGQLAELEKQRQAEIAKKKTDNSVVEDYNKQIEEMKIAIRDFAMEAAKDLYGIDLNGWAEQLGSSLVDAFAAGEDAAEAFDKTVGDILRDITSKMIAQDILAPMFGDLRNYLFGTNGKGGAFGADFKLDASEVAAMKEYLDRIKNEGIPAAENLFDAINEATGGLLDETDKSKSGLSAGIQSVTEDTADLLASYINAIRASVAMNETRWERLLNDSIPQMNVIAESQLRTQQQIAANTLRNAIAAEAIVKSNDEINRLLARVTQGGAKFYIH